MDNKLVESYLEYIAGKVVDENEIVTYKSLSRNLNIHVNTAKQLLHTYLTNEKANNTYQISATYLIAGKVIDGSFSVSIVNESDLKTASSKLIQTTSEHVYSVQKGKNLKDVKCLCGINKKLASNSSNLVIKYWKNVLKPKEVKKKSKSDEAENKNVIEQALGSTKETVVAESVKKVEVIPNDRTNNKKTSPKEKSEKTQAGNKKPSGNIANLFAKANQKNAERSIKADSLKNEQKSAVVNNEQSAVVNSEQKSAAVNSEEKSAVANSEEVRNGRNIKKGSSKKRSESKESLKGKREGNKRRRIQVLSDSEESSTDDEEEHIEIDQEEEEPQPAVTNFEEVEETKEITSKNKRKKRKVIDKTVMNEDGYLETKKEVVFETDSENEAEEVTKVKEEKKPKVDKGKGPQGPKKQSSLLLFFKKS